MVEPNRTHARCFPGVPKWDRPAMAKHDPTARARRIAAAWQRFRKEL